jgi:hypothetical protein
MDEASEVTSYSLCFNECHIRVACVPVQNH